MKKGFSIAEVIISLFVITVGLITVLGLIASSIRESAASRNRIIGAQLAQEGVELLRNVRDNNLLTEGETYKTGLDTDMSGRINYSTDTAAVGPGPFLISGGYYLLSYNSSTMKYVHNGLLPATPFYREMTIDYDNPVGTGDIKVSGKVWWGGPSEPANCNAANKCILVQDSLTEHP